MGWNLMKLKSNFRKSPYIWRILFWSISLWQNAGLPLAASTWVVVFIWWVLSSNCLILGVGHRRRVHVPSRFGFDAEARGHAMSAILNEKSMEISGLPTSFHFFPDSFHQDVAYMFRQSPDSQNIGEPGPWPYPNGEFTDQIRVQRCFRWCHPGRTWSLRLTWREWNESQIAWSKRSRSHFVMQVAREGKTLVLGCPQCWKVWQTYTSHFCWNWGLFVIGASYITAFVGQSTVVTGSERRIGGISLVAVNFVAPLLMKPQHPSRCAAMIICHH